MLKIGLTGGICCGKSTVSRIFETLNIPVIDADEIAHQLVAIDQPALAELQRLFSSNILNKDGSLNRSMLRELIFSDPKKKQLLENLLHPLIYEALNEAIKQIKNTPYCIICVPLLLETNMTHLVDRILVVDCSVETQIMRLQKRDNMSLKSIQSIIDNQVTRTFRRAKADDLIDNSENNNRLAEHIKTLHNFYHSLSTRQDKLVCE